jgi:hypothetical protein
MKPPAPARVAVGQEAVAEFRVTASNVAPEFGGAAGGNLNVVTLSGANRFHGDVNLFAADAFIPKMLPGAYAVNVTVPGFKDFSSCDRVLFRRRRCGRAISAI